MPLERANLPLERVFRGADDKVIGQGYKWLKIGNKGASYEKFLGHKSDLFGDDLSAGFKVIRIEQDDDGNYIFMACHQDGLSGHVGHRAVWLTFDEVKAVYEQMKKFRRRSKMAGFFTKKRRKT